MSSPLKKNHPWANKFNVESFTTLLGALEVRDCFTDNSHAEYYLPRSEPFGVCEGHIRCKAREL